MAVEEKSLIPEVIGGPEYPSAKDLRIPKTLLKQVMVTRTGRKRDPMAVAWLYRFMETGQATQSVLDVGFNAAQPSLKAYSLKQQFADVLVGAVKFQRLTTEPKALRMLDLVLDIAMSPKNADNPQMLGVGVKAAVEILDRGDMPRGAKIHGLETAPSEVKTAASAHELIDRLVESVGIEAVRLMKGIVDYKAHRDYLESKEPPVLIEVNADA